MNSYVFRSPRLGFRAVEPSLSAPAAAFYRRNRAAFAPFDPVPEEEFFTEPGQRARLELERSWAECDPGVPLPAGPAPPPRQGRWDARVQRNRPGRLPILFSLL